MPKTFISAPELHALFTYDPKEDDLRHKEEGSLARGYVDTKDIDVQGKEYYFVGRQYPYVPKQSLIDWFCSQIRSNYSSGDFVYDSANRPPTPERIRELFHYDSLRGILIHKKTRGGVTAGTVVGSRSRNPDKPLMITIDGHRTTVHRVIYILENEISPRDPIFHKDGDKTYNFIGNLYVKHQCPLRPPQTHYKENSFGVESVIWNNKVQKWCSLVDFANSFVSHIGYHDVFIDAVKEVVRAAKRHKQSGIEIMDAQEYLKKHEPEYLESLGY